MSSKPPLSVTYVQPESEDHESDNTLAVRFSSGSYERLVHFHGEGAKLVATGDALLCLGLIPALELGVDLHIGADVDQVLMDGAARIQDLICAWYPGIHRISVDADTTSRTYPDNRGTGLFFSGGVDSSFSLALKAGGLDGIVTIIGADVDSADRPRANRLKTIVGDAAAEYGLKPIIVTTDLRRVSDRLIGWVEYHGAVLAAVRHFLGHEFENQLIASSADGSSWNRRWGSHPGLDHLWGTEAARLEHHGLVDRLSKIDRISREPVLMRHLRVCNKEFEHCGSCDSCRFMLAALDVLDARALAPTYSHLAHKPPLLRVTGEGSLSDLAKMRAAARENGSRQDVVAAIDRAMRQYRFTKRFQNVLPYHEAARGFKRIKRQWRFGREVRRQIR